MFSDIYDELNKKVRLIISQTKAPSDSEEIYDLVHSDNLTLEDCAKLLHITNNKFDHLGYFDYVSRRKFEKEILLKSNKKVLKHIAPIYLSNYCADACAYCDFSIKNNIKRIRLSLEEFESEIETVITQGSKVIELTLSSDLKFTSQVLQEYISKANSKLSKEKGSGVLLCSNYLSKEEYFELKKEGLFTVVQWDETLDEKKYLKFHQGSKFKANFKERINTHDKALQAGLQVATGCLFGLADFKYDVLMQIAKANYLEKEYRVNPLIFGTPRINNGLIADDEYKKALTIYRLAKPKIGRWLQTRESHELNMSIATHGDYYTYNCGNVKPGGYNINKVDKSVVGQFKVIEYTRSEFETQFLNPRNFKLNYSWTKNK